MKIKLIPAKFSVKTTNIIHDTSVDAFYLKAGNKVIKVFGDNIIVTEVSWSTLASYVRGYNGYVFVTEGAQLELTLTSNLVSGEKDPRYSTH